MKHCLTFLITATLISFNAELAIAQNSFSGFHLTTGVFQSIVSDYPFSPYLLKGATPLIKAGASWGGHLNNDLRASVAFPKLHPREAEQNEASASFLTLHYGFLPAVVRNQRWNAWVGPSLTARGSHRELEQSTGEFILSLDASMKVIIPVTSKDHFSGSLFFPVVSFVVYQGYGLGNEQMDWTSFSKLQSVTSEISYSRLLSPSVSLRCAYEFMYYQYTLAEKKKVLTQQFQIGFTFHFKSNAS